MRIVYFIILFTFTFKISKNQGLTNSLNEIADMNNVLGAKNLLPNNATNQTVNGVTFTVNDDGSITANGTASANTGFTIALDIDARGMILSGCPAGGSRSTYSLQYTNYVDESFADEGNGITIPLSTNTGLWRVAIWITAQSIVNNLVFKPMIRPASITDDTYVPYSMTNREMTPYVQSISNPNLLDNAWFTVNQRGQSSYTTSIGTHIYTVDRWKTYSLSVDVIDNGVTLTNVENNYVNFYSQQENYVLNKLLRKTLTLSVMLSDGTIYSGNITINNRSTEYILTDYRAYTSDTFAIGILEDKGSWQIYVAVSPNKSVSIRAVKLEIGSISTLSMDSAPNYAEELLKCQRYFVRFSTNNTARLAFHGFFSVIDSIDTTKRDVWMAGMLPVVMRATPYVSSNDITKWFFSTSHNGNQLVKFLSTLNVERINGNSIFIVATVDNSNTEFGTYGQLWCDTANCYLDLSADL